MSSTHLSLYYHLVFSTHDRLRWIDKSWQERLAQYIGGIVRDFDWHSTFPGLRAALRRFTPGYCSIGASDAQYKCINSRRQLRCRIPRALPPITTMWH
jgi:hypothetical protein